MARRSLKPRVNPPPRISRCPGAQVALGAPLHAQCLADESVYMAFRSG